MPTTVRFETNRDADNLRDIIELDGALLSEVPARPLLPSARGRDAIDFGKLSESIRPAPAVSSMPPPMPAAKTYSGTLDAPSISKRTMLIAGLGHVSAGALLCVALDTFEHRQAQRKLARVVESNGAFAPMTDESEFASEMGEAAAAIGPQIRIESASAEVVDAKTLRRDAKLAAAPTTPTSVTPVAPRRAPMPDAALPRVAPKVAAQTVTTEKVAELPATEKPKTDPSLPAQPNREAVQAALLAVRPAVMACSASRHGAAPVEVSIGPSGRVRNAVVGGAFAGTPEGSCIARAVRTAKFPAFSAEDFRVTFPYQL